MTFEEWMQENVGLAPYSKHDKRLWQAATQQERERCARIAEEHPCVEPTEVYRNEAPWSLGLNEEWEVYQCYYGDAVAAAIREADA